MSTNPISPAQACSAGGLILARCRVHTAVIHEAAAVPEEALQIKWDACTFSGPSSSAGQRPGCLWHLICRPALARSWNAAPCTLPLLSPSSGLALALRSEPPWPCRHAGGRAGGQHQQARGAQGGAQQLHAAEPGQSHPGAGALHLLPPRGEVAAAEAQTPPLRHPHAERHAARCALWGCLPMGVYGGE